MFLVLLLRHSGMVKYTWFPGHMAKALREMKSKSKYADLVLEVRDARVSAMAGAAGSCGH